MLCCKGFKKVGCYLLFGCSSLKRINLTFHNSQICKSSLLCNMYTLVILTPVQHNATQHKRPTTALKASILLRLCQLSFFSMHYVLYFTFLHQHAATNKIMSNIIHKVKRLCFTYRKYMISNAATIILWP